MRKHLAMLLGSMAIASACTAAPGPPPPSQPPPVPPPIGNPIVLSGFRERPCAAVPPHLGTADGLNRRKAIPQWRTVLRDGRDPLCALFGSSGLGELDVRLYQNIRPATVWAARYPKVHRTSLHGYPATIALLPTKGGPDAFSVCTTYIDTAHNQGIAVAYHGRTGTTADPCPPSRRAAAAMVAHLMK